MIEYYIQLLNVHIFVSMPLPKNHKTEWDLSLLYKSLDDPQIYEDIDLFINSCNEFAKKYGRVNDYLIDESKLLLALKDFEKLLIDLKSAKPLNYYQFINCIDSENHVATAQLTKLTEKLSKAENNIKFFSVKLGKIKRPLQKKFLSSLKLQSYRYLLEQRFKSAKHDLSLAEEKILNLMNLPASQMWVEGVQKSLNRKMVEHDGEMIPISKATGLYSELPTLERRALHSKIDDQLKSLAEFCESELNAIYTHKKITDDLRKYKRPYDSTILHYENDSKTVENLVKVISKNMKIANRFFKLKARLLNEKTLLFADRAASVGKLDLNFSFEKAYELTYDCLKNYSQEFADELESMIIKGQIDVYPRKGKRGGAFCAGEYGFETFILLNHTDNYNSTTTLAHEIGHALHTKLSKTQNVFYFNYSTSTAEVASTFFEDSVTEIIARGLTDPQKVIFLHDKIKEDVATIFAQIAYFNFETSLHNTIRDKGHVTHQEISKLFIDQMRKYLGPVFNLADDDGYFFVRVSHFRSFFYVYTYAYGGLIAKALLNRVRSNPKELDKVLEFLKAGGSDSPENIFKKIGIDVNDPKFFEEGLKEIERNIDELESLMNKLEHKAN